VHPSAEHKKYTRSVESRRETSSLQMSHKPRSLIASIEAERHKHARACNWSGPSSALITSARVSRGEGA